MIRQLTMMVLATAAVLTYGCSTEPAGEPELETVDVDARPTDQLTPEGDEQGQPLRALSGAEGVLPSSFPDSVPVYRPSSLIDFNDGAGQHFILLGTAQAPDAVRSKQLQQLRTAGFSETGGGRYSNGSVSVRVDVRPGENAETEILIEY